MASKGRRGSAAFLVGGALLLAAALALTGYNLSDGQRAGADAERVWEELSRQVAENTQAPAEQTEELEIPDYILSPEMEMPTLEIEGDAYIGILEIPTLGLSLPVMSQWSYSGLRIAPGRYAGSAYTGNLVIAGHNYRAHFGRLSSLSPGDQVVFTDVMGNQFVYEVVETEVLEPTAVEALLSEEWDLTLFTCTYGGQSRVTVRCLKADR